MALLVRVVAIGASVPLLMRLSLPRLAAVLSMATGRTGMSGCPSEDHVQRVATCVAAVQGGRVPLVRSGCLTRGVTLYWLLRRAGVPVELCFGMDKVDGELAGHCWLVRDGRPYLEPAEFPDSFPAFYRIPAPRP
ncbi:MAG: lasso peptide biosynthesis B2 protein [Acidimicrobiales bacterium]